MESKNIFYCTCKSCSRIFKSVGGWSDECVDCRRDGYEFTNSGFDYINDTDQLTDFTAVEKEMEILVEKNKEKKKDYPMWLYFVGMWLGGFFIGFGVGWLW